MSNRDIMSASSSSSSLLYSSSTRPQQDGLAFHDDGIVRQTPPSWRQAYVTPRRQYHSPLILDPSAPSSVAVSESESSSDTRLRQLGGTAAAATAGSVRKLLEAATTSTRRRRDDHDHREEEPERRGTTTTTAASFARTAPRAGFLSKLGTNIPEFKRRFFVLKPSTHLYYFLSPADTEPRGCIDMDSVQVRELQHLPDGRFRFAVQLLQDKNERQEIILEARNEDVGRQWMESIAVERMSHVKTEMQKLQGMNAQYKARIEELERTLEEYKLVERDRDGALEDASNWKSQFERLNEGLRLLTHHLRRAPEDDKKKKAPNLDEQPVTTDSDENVQSAHDKCLLSTPSASSHRETSLLDDINEEEQHIDDLEFPGTHFSALLNACQQLRESLRLASVEASSAVEDLNSANEKMFATEKRMRKAEKHICKLWEENCAMRKSLKQSKTEKRVLVREVKSLMAVVNETSQKLKHTTSQLPQDRPAATPSDDEQRNVSPSEEERLIDELEEHVMTSIRLHEQFLGVNNGLADQLLASVQKIETGSYSENDDDPAFALGMHVSRTTDSPTMPRIDHCLPHAAMESNTSHSSDTGKSAKLSPIKPKLLSLFDDQSDDDDSVDDEEKSTAPSVISSVGAELGDVHDDLLEGTSIKTEASATHSSDGRLQGESQIPLRVGLSAFTPLAVEDDHVDVSVASDKDERKHPILRLDEEVDEETTAPNLCGSSTQSESTQSIITDNGNATSRLVCPLADVIGIRRKVNKQIDPGFFQDGKVYHLTFYSRKIGIQFQKVKVETRSRGLLTEAMTADLLDGKSDGSTAAELRRIATISNLATTSSLAPKTDEFCQVATPVDAVLVCGFHGFDDKANHVRPNIGARLVAFDGISVEVGRWTFDSVRKAIQARGRPLTLSFRNDFLTTKQRAILTKAVADIEKAIPRQTIQYKQQRPPSAESIMSSQSHETEQFVNDAHPCDDDDMSVSVASSARYSTLGRSSFSASHSIASYQGYRSFSDAGSSSVFSSTLGPLVGNLMTNLKKNESSSGIPSYLRSNDAESLENAPYHQDFTSSLL